MALKHYDFEAGTNGAAATAANTGASLITLNSGTATFDTTAAANKTLGLKLVAAATGAATVARFNANAGSLQMSYAMSVIIVDVAPAVNTMIATLRHSAGIALRMYVGTNGHLLIDGSAVSGVVDTGVTLTQNSQFRIEVQATVGTTTTDGVVSVSVFAGNATTPLAPATTSSTFNLGTNPIVAADLLTDTGRTIKFDDIRFSDGSTTPLGPVPAAAPATANAGPDQADRESLTLVTLAGSGATDGVYSWRQLTGVAVTLSSKTVAKPTFMSPAHKDGAALSFGLTVGATPSAEDTVRISVRPHQLWSRVGGVWKPVITYVV